MSSAMNARERFNHAYDNRHRCGALGAQDIEMMCAEIDSLRSLVARLRPDPPESEEYYT